MRLEKWSPVLGTELLLTSMSPEKGLPGAGAGARMDGRM